MKNSEPTVIIGGGNSGCRFALKCINEGIPFLLFEQNIDLGGLKKIAGNGISEQEHKKLNDHSAVLTKARVQGIDSSLEVIVEINGAMKRIQASKIILATGSWELPIPFPGWTLPGVMSSNSAKLMFYRDDISFGNKIVLLKSNEESDQFIKDLYEFHEEVITLDINYIQSLECFSKNGKVNQLKYIRDQKESSIKDMDTLICSSVSAAELDLLEAAGGEAVEIAKGSSYTEVGLGETTLKNIYTVGSAQNNSLINVDYSNCLKFSNEFTTICRCEEINQIEIETAISSGANSLDDIKRLTRCGMGFCQWKMCKASVMEILKRHKGLHHEIRLPKLRFPLTPIHIETLATLPIKGEEGVVDILSNAINQRQEKKLS
ncbi:FAD/NAD(P)-dependent oxidoreductase [Alkalihalobacterium elongatum]|uniref:FAD/NAD(P)-dependent oxidoreductase n=1 Tax=Alkalihalobacterium elongatum TaxID=2675466 RepID=UPI001C1F4B86|nr:NAD(P)/FAD-dependent oxidoreductase [Alkalihalobacterium elongatum]